MKRMLLASVLALLGGTLSFADDTGRAFIRSIPEASPATVPEVTPASAVFPNINLGLGRSMNSCSTGGCSSCARKDDRLGLHPILAKLMFWKKDCNSCKKCGGLFGPRCGGGYAAAAFNPYPDGVPGTLVFPQHPFVRSPRDFWMWEPK